MRMTTRRPSGRSLPVTSGANVSTPVGGAEAGAGSTGSSTAENATICRGLPSVEHREVGGRQATHRPAVLVQHRYVELYGVDAGAERGWLRGREVLLGRDADQYRKPASEQADGVFHEGFLGGAGGAL